jgi:hypothetical protein
MYLLKIAGIFGLLVIGVVVIVLLTPDGPIKEIEEKVAEEVAEDLLVVGVESLI